VAQDQILPKQKVIIETATTIGTKYLAILSANFVSVLWSDWLNYHLH
jgi:hypothetical protein